VEWVSDFIAFLYSVGYSRIEAQQSAEKEWGEHVKEFYKGSMIADTLSWFTGYYSNIEGHDLLRHMTYLGGASTYGQKLKEVKEEDYRGINFS